jgi:ankyrin repeat protein
MEIPPNPAGARAPSWTRPSAPLALLLAALLTLLAGCSAKVARYASAGKAESVQKLLAAGESPDGTDWKGRSAIELAVHYQHADAVEALAKGGARLDRLGKRGMAPLHDAARRGNSQIVQILVDAGASTDLEDVRGYTALGWGFRGQHWTCLEILATSGARVITPSDVAAGIRSLAAAVRKNDKKNVKIALTAGVDPDADDKKGRSARFLAEHQGHDDLVALFDAGAIEAPPVAPVPTPALPKPAVAKAPRSALVPAPPKPVVRTAPPAPSTVTLASPAPPVVASGDALPDGLELGRYHALVIGNNDYQHLPPLRTAVNDTVAVEQMLRDHYGYSVTRLENATRADILHGLGEYRRSLGPSDNLLIYYAGHGWLDTDGDRGYWLPVDATSGDEVHWVDNGSVTSAVRAMQAKHVLVIADSCYSGKLTRGIHIARRTPGYMERLATRRARVVLTSGGLEPVMDSGGQGQHSVFASALLQVLRENTGVLEGHELFSRLRRPVALNSDQVPEYADIRKAGHEGGDFLFVRTR